MDVGRNERAGALGAVVDFVDVAVEEARVETGVPGKEEGVEEDEAGEELERDAERRRGGLRRERGDGGGPSCRVAGAATRSPRG